MDQTLVCAVHNFLELILPGRLSPLHGKLQFHPWGHYHCAGYKEHWIHNLVDPNNPYFRPMCPLRPEN